MKDDKIYDDSIDINELFDPLLLKQANGMELSRSKEEMFIHISYSAEYKRLLGILSKLINTKEFSSRTCWIVTRILEMNSNHYCLWIFRTIHFMSNIILNNIEREWKWIQDLTIENPKCYQIW